MSRTWTLIPEGFVGGFHPDTAIPLLSSSRAVASPV